MAVLPVDILVSKHLHNWAVMSHEYTRMLCMMRHYCVTVSNIWASMELVKTSMNQPVFTKEGNLFVESWFFILV